MTSERTANLASVFQEVLTVIVRVRFHQQSVSNAEVFRSQIRQSLQEPMQRARTLGYSNDIIRGSVFAVVALLDESVLNLQDPVFAQWSRQPIQEELFGGHLAGETFFRNLRAYLSLPDSAQLADVLELYCLCLLLGYRGRYALGDSGELHELLRQARSRIRRIRGSAEFLPALPATQETTPTSRPDRWQNYLLWTVCVLAGVLVAVFAGYHISLSHGAAAFDSSALNAF